MDDKKQVILPEMDIFKHLYYELKGKVEDENEAMKSRDLTNEINLYLEQKIKYKELIVIELKGEVGSGKSVLALELQNRTNRIIERFSKKKINDFRWIASDQIEFTRLTKTKEENICVEVDEFSDLARTGANATTEVAEFEFFSNVCRIQYIHRIMCSPATLIDKNTHVILTVVGANKKEKMTQVKVTYRNPSEGVSRVIGSAWIDVSNVLSQEYYKKYEKKKLMRIELLQSIGVRDIRELEYAVIALKTISKLNGLAQRSGVKLSIIRTTINRICKAMQLRTSYIAEDEIAKPVHSILDSINVLQKMKTNEDRIVVKDIINEEIKELKRLEVAYNEYLYI